MDNGGKTSSGVPGLDDILHGGFPTGQLYLIEGHPGAGKTTMGLQFLLDGVRRGETCVFITLTESESAIRRLARSHGWDLDGIHIIESSDQDPGSDYSIFHPTEVELGETSRSMFGRIDALNPSRVVIDSLSEVRIIARDPLRYRRQILALRKFFDERRITALLLDFLADAGDRQLESLCHGIVSLLQMSPEYGGQRRRLRVVKLRESGFRDGFHDFAIHRGGLEVYPRLVAAEHHRAGEYVQQTMSTGIAELDKLMGGGVDRGTTTLILGPAGAGKSTLAAQIGKASVERGEKVANFIFDEVPNTLVVRGDGMGLRIREFMETGRLMIRQVDPAELSPGQFAHMVRRSIDVDGASTVVIDSVNGYQSAMPEEHHLSAHLHELLAYLNQKRIVTILVLTQAGFMGTGLSSPIDLSYLADTVVLLRYFEVSSEIRQAISCVKRRTGEHERAIRELKLDAGGLRVGGPLTGFSGIMAGQLVYTGLDKMLAEREGSADGSGT